MSTIAQIQEALAGAGSLGDFATRRTGAAADLRLEVSGVGRVPLPLSPTIARKLCGVARPARYGLREQTLLDRRVRDTWQIGRHQFEIDMRRWQPALARQLALIARDLGLPDGARLRAEPHDLLVYGPIEHHDEQVSYRAAADRLVLVAFYADCRHEVRPLTSGYRAALTYNLFVDGTTSASARTSAPSLDHLTALVRSYFATPRPGYGPGWPSQGPPERLVYLLDHEYTQAGLSWRRLKNGDAARVAALREVAERLDCEIVLALADVHESWSCEDDWGSRGYGWRRRSAWDDRYDEDDEEEGEARTGTDDHTLIELCVSEIELRHWLAPSGKQVQRISGEVHDDEVCFTKPSVELEPFRSQHEGYTGNAGNTVDRWYHRAAVLVWPRSRTFALRAKAAPAWGIREIAKTLARGARARPPGSASTSCSRSGTRWHRSTWRPASSIGSCRSRRRSTTRRARRRCSIRSGSNA